MRRTVLVLGIAMLAIALPARADRAGCTVIAPNPSGGGSCSYTANGPGVFTAHVPVGGWWIEASSDGGETWRRAAIGESVVDDRTPGWPEPMPWLYPPASGEIDTRFGDVVIATIRLDHACTPFAGCQQIRIGSLEVRDRT